MDARNETELDALLTWLRAPDVGGARFARVLARCGSARRALAAGPDAWRACGVPESADAWLAAPDRARLDADRAWLARPGHHLVVRGDADYPPQLARGNAPPAALFVHGDVDLLWRAQVAIVGSRNATPGGLACAADFAAALADAGLAITSGLAAGIDGAAHRATLAAGGATIAVCGTGVDACYPKRHAALHAEIAARGAIVSEYPLGTPSAAEHFPRRNRIIAALALGTLVVEAGLESGSLITARLATEQGREVFAVPGSIHSPVKRGCHRLLRDGAKLVECAQDVLDELGPLARELANELRERLERSACASDVSREPQSPKSRVRSTCRSDASRESRRFEATSPSIPEGAQITRGESPSKQALLAALADDALGVDDLRARTGLTVAALSAMLTALELDGELAALPGGLWTRRPRQCSP